MEALTKKSSKSHRAIGMYMEALRALARNDGPESLHVAAYELREFMNALPPALDVPVVPYEQLKAMVHSFVGGWKRQSDKTTCLKDGRWDGEIDNGLRELLERIATFVAWVDEQVPSRRVEAAVVLGRLAPTPHPLPRALLQVRTDEWSDLLRYFNGYTHHNSDPDPVEFGQQLERLEVFLLEHLEPRTFEDQAEIDRLIREVEG